MTDKPQTPPLYSGIAFQKPAPEYYRQIVRLVQLIESCGLLGADPNIPALADNIPSYRATLS